MASLHGLRSNSKRVERSGAMVMAPEELTLWLGEIRPA
jgi:hypothetical protein